jgi:uncharacterized Zn-finger protein
MSDTMNSEAVKIENRVRHIEVSAADLPLHCPTPTMILWNAHPRVFLPIEKSGEALCPYCGTRYTLKGPVSPSY